MFAYYGLCLVVVFFFKQKTAYEMRISDWSSDVCSSDLVAGGVKYNSGGLHAVLDAAYQTSTFRGQNIPSDIGQRIESLTLTEDVDGHAEYTVPGNALLSRENLYIRHALSQDLSVDKGHLVQVQGDVDYEFDGFMSNLAAIGRSSCRERVGPYVQITVVAVSFN